MTIAQPHVLGIVVGIQLVVTGLSFALARREIARNPAASHQGPADGYALLVSVCAGLLAMFGIWAVTELAEAAGLEVYLGGHNAFGVFLIGFFGLIILGALLTVVGRLILIDVATRHHSEN